MRISDWSSVVCSSDLVAFLDAQEQTDRGRKAGTIGYDLGASYAFRAAAARPDRIAAVGSIYGESVAAARPNSPHLLVTRTRARSAERRVGKEGVRTCRSR